MSHTGSSAQSRRSLVSISANGRAGALGWVERVMARMSSSFRDGLIINQRLTFD
jgi:hypothetical protein